MESEVCEQVLLDVQAAGDDSSEEHEQLFISLDDDQLRDSELGCDRIAREIKQMSGEHAACNFQDFVQGRSDCNPQVHSRHSPSCIRQFCEPSVLTFTMLQHKSLMLHDNAHRLFVLMPLRLLHLIWWLLVQNFSPILANRISQSSLECLATEA